MFYHLRFHKFSKVKDLLFLSFLSALGFVIANVIGTLYLDDFGFSSSTIGYIFLVLGILKILATMSLTPFLEKIDEYKLYLISIFLMGMCYLIIYFLSNVYYYIILSFFILLLFALYYNLQGIFLKDTSKKRKYEKMNVFLLEFQIFLGFWVH